MTIKTNGKQCFVMSHEIYICIKKTWSRDFPLDMDINICKSIILDIMYSCVCNKLPIQTIAQQ